YIRCGADVNVVDADGCNALHHAAVHGNSDTIRHLIEAGVQINVYDEVQHATPLQYAASSGDLRSVQYLVDAGADLEAVDNDGQTVLMTASLGDSLPIVKYLVGSGANVNSKNDDDSTPLHYAVWTCNRQIEIAQFLIASGADYTARTK